MPTILELLKKAEEFLARKGISNARLQAELLFAHVLKCRRLDLYLQFERPLSKPQVERLRALLVRRGNREPLQYIVGSAPFRTLELKCDPRALIPRPETEELLDHVFERLDKISAQRKCGDNPALPQAPLRVLDLGTGTGAIALSVAAERAGTIVVAVDFSEPALALARENAAACEISGVEFLRSDWFENVAGAFDAIVANPPYLTQAELASAESEVRDHEPVSALVAADSGFRDLEKIVRGAFSHLVAGGFLALETGIAHHNRLAALAAEIGYRTGTGICDLSRRPRFFFAEK
ncbi:MAG: peptide chain release factor N(5)-glutamine methyltransferase [Opitutae bacterium]|nr:peptide chain release factor N(5)-glutamine methyltransferase [Opitutae bacterium]MCD8299449.1 peptide chain release factor N(5)-glutamine methyltransferase [Opitutae bacterium]